MKLIFILFSSIIYSFSFSLTPDEIISSVRTHNYDRFYKIKIENCKDFDAFYKRMEIPFI